MWWHEDVRFFKAAWRHKLYVKKANPQRHLNLAKRNLFFLQTACLSTGAGGAFSSKDKVCSMISRPCFWGNAYYVVAQHPCLLWPWRLLPWCSEASQNQRGYHRNYPTKEKWPTHCILSHFLVNLYKHILSRFWHILQRVPLSRASSSFPAGSISIFPFKVFKCYMNSLKNTKFL